MKMVSSLLARAVILTLNFSIMNYVWVTNVSGLEICFAFHFKHTEHLLAEIVIYFWHPISPSVTTPKDVHDGDSRKALLFTLQPSKGFGTNLRERMGHEVSLLVSTWEWITGGSVPEETPTATWEHGITKWVFLGPAVLWISENKWENSGPLTCFPTSCFRWLLMAKMTRKMNYGAHMVHCLLLLLDHKTLVLLEVKICPIPGDEFWLI